MSLSPNYDVPENVSPFVELPILVRCSSCGEPQEPLGLYARVEDGVRVTRDLCATCARVGDEREGSE